MLSVESVLIEVRQCIGCANIFLQFNKPLKGSGQNLKVHLEPYKILLKNENNNELGESGLLKWEIVFNDYFNIVANSLNNLIVDDRNVSFRISIKNISTKLLLNMQQENDTKNIFNAIDDTMKPLIKENQQLEYVCSNCDNLLCLKHSYKRIRALPSTVTHSNEFFCHAKTNFSNLFIPNIDDLFFGYQYIVINCEIFLNDNKETKNFTSMLNRHDDNVYCHKCLKLIGIMMFDGKAIKLWSDTINVKFYTENLTTTTTTTTTKVAEAANYNTKEVSKIFSNLNILNESYELLMKIIRDCSIGFEKNTHFIQNKLHIKAIIQTIALTESQQTEHLLINIIEKDLQILQKQLHESINEDNNNKNDKSLIKLHFNKALKIFYKIIRTDNFTNKKDCYEQEHILANAESKYGQPLLAYWQKDFNVIQMDVSPYLFRDLINQLQRNVLILPKQYRNTPDGFQTSYIIY